MIAQNHSVQWLIIQNSPKGSLFWISALERKTIFYQVQKDKQVASLSANQSKHKNNDGPMIKFSSKWGSCVY